MITQVKLKVYTCEEFQRRWSARAWKKTPSKIITLPFPGGVLFGAEERDSAQSVCFYLNPDDALIIGQKLINAARETQKK